LLQVEPGRTPDVPMENGKGMAVDVLADGTVG
jgi:hypothetical protein